MYPHLQIELASMLTALYCVNVRYRLKSINYFKGEHAQTQFWSNFEIKKCCGYLEYKVNVIQNLINSFLSLNNVSMQVRWRKTHWFRKQSSEKADFIVFLRMMT